MNHTFTLILFLVPADLFPLGSMNIFSTDMFTEIYMICICDIVYSTMPWLGAKFSIDNSSYPLHHTPFILCPVCLTVTLNLHILLFRKCIEVRVEEQVPLVIYHSLVSCHILSLNIFLHILPIKVF